MPKLVEYECSECDHIEEEIFGDTEESPTVLGIVCPKCGGVLKKGRNLKKNCQVWRWNDFNGI